MEFAQSFLAAMGVNEATFTVGALVFARLFAFFAIIPTVSGDFVPGFVRAIFLLSLVPFAVGAAESAIADPDALAQYTGIYLSAMLVKEVIFGIAVGFVIGLPLRILALSGDVIDNQRGAAIAESFNPSSGDQSALLGQFLSQVAFAYFIVNGGFQFLLNVVFASYLVLPVDGMLSLGAISEDLVYSLLTDFLRLFIVLAMPIMLAMFIAEMGLALSSRFAQAINVYTLAQPVKSGVAIVVVFYMLGDIIVKTHEYMDELGLKLFDVGLLVAP